MSWLNKTLNFIVLLSNLHKYYIDEDIDIFYFVVLFNANSEL